MGKRLIQQRRGKGDQRYKAPSKNYVGRVIHLKNTVDILKGNVLDIVNCPGHYAPIAKVKYENGENCLVFATDGMKVGDSISAGKGIEIRSGNLVELKDIPEGTLIYNIESQPGDGGKFCRTSGSFGRLLSKSDNLVTVILPSKKEKKFPSGCRANIGVIAGAGRKEKPFIKAGKKYFAKRARNKMWPSVSGSSMNSVDHPFGGSSSCRHNKPRQSSKHAPPGRKVGSISPKRTGRKR
jgi:large subunit ribosomal protein L2